MAALLLSVALLLMGNGLQGTLVPVRGNLEAFQPLEIGFLGTMYFLGFTFGCFNGPALVRRAGHIRTFLAMTSVASVVALLHVLYIDALFWSALRCVTGYSFAVLYIVIESWLNERSDNYTRGTVFSIYTIINLTVITVGQMMLALSDPRTFALFAVASILVSLAALPVAFTRSASPAPSLMIRPRLTKLYRVSPVGVAGCLAVGLANGSFWTLGPVFAQNQGFDTASIGLFMSVSILGGALSQWPLGRLSDRVDRRVVIVGAACVALLAGFGLMAVIGDVALTCLFGALFGAGAFPIYPISVAHANDHADAADYVEVSSGLLLIFGIGAATGPLVASLLRHAAQGPTLFYFTAIVHVALIAFVVWRIRLRDRAPQSERVVFADAAIAAQTVSNIDPLASEAAGPPRAR